MSEWTSGIYNSNNRNLKEEQIEKVYCLLVCLTASYLCLGTVNGKIQKLEDKKKMQTLLNKILKTNPSFPKKKMDLELLFHLKLFSILRTSSIPSLVSSCSQYNWRNIPVKSQITPQLSESLVAIHFLLQDIWWFPVVALMSSCSL